MAPISKRQVLKHKVSHCRHLLINPSHRSIDNALHARVEQLLEDMGEAEMKAYLSECVYLENNVFLPTLLPILVKSLP